MQKLVWSDELSHVAELNAQTCTMTHDCPASPSFLQASQNLASRKFTSPPGGREILIKLIAPWFYEYFRADLSYIDNSIEKLTRNYKKSDFLKMKNLKCPGINTDGSYTTGHYGTFVQDTLTHIGCAFYKCGPIINKNGKEAETFYLVCNYDRTVTSSSKLYETSDIGGSKCSKKSSKYCGLCLDKEEEDTGPCHEVTYTLPDWFGQNDDEDDEDTAGGDSIDSIPTEAFQPPESFCSKVENICGDTRHLHCGGSLVPKEIIGNNPNNIELTPILKLYILKKLNELRNIIACGEPKVTNVAGDTFPMAAKMPKLSWDNELEWLADLNAKTCLFNMIVLFLKNTHQLVRI
uniref:SCP domain-containing protein n=1 Tax=Megaselia scalaris TaxID=36166 RepID=T1GS07_MEGSC